MAGIVAEGPGRRLRLLAALASAAFLSGCYLAQAAAGQAEVLARSRPIPEVVADPATPPDLRARLELATEAREFAVRELGLPDGEAYTPGRELKDLKRKVAELEDRLRELGGEQA